MPLAFLACLIDLIVCQKKKGNFRFPFRCNRVTEINNSAPPFDVIDNTNSLTQLNGPYYEVNQSFLVDLFFIGFMIKVAGVGRSGPRDINPVRYTVHPLLVETCLRWLGHRFRITSEAMTL